MKAATARFGEDALRVVYDPRLATPAVVSQVAGPRVGASDAGPAVTGSATASGLVSVMVMGTPPGRSSRRFCSGDKSNEATIHRGLCPALIPLAAPAPRPS